MFTMHVGIMNVVYKAFYLKPNNPDTCQLGGSHKSYAHIQRNLQYFNKEVLIVGILPFKYFLLLNLSFK